MDENTEIQLIKRVKPIIPIKNNIITFPTDKTCVPPPPDESSPKRVMPKPPKVPQPPPISVSDEMMDLLDLPIPLPMLRKEAKKQNKEELMLEKEIDLITKYRRNPLLFWRDELGIPIDIWRNDLPPKEWQLGDPVPLWSKQREIIKSVVEYRKVAVKSGHGIGKTFLAGGIALYLAYVWHATGLTTAPTFRQVRRALWGEIHYLFNKARNPLGGTLNQVSLDLGDKWFVEGFATDKPIGNITGIHEENVFVIIDEAGGVQDDTFEALEAILTSENSFVLYIGNPIVAEGAFAEAFKPNSGFKQFTMSCYDCPNVRHDRVIYSKLTSRKWVEDKEKKWGVNSNLFRSRVAGEFPEETRDTLISLKYIEEALRKGNEGGAIRDEIIGFGVDVARQGSDSTVISVRYKSGYFEIVETTTKKRETDTAGRIQIMYDKMVPAFKYRKLSSLTLPGRKKEDEEKKDFPPINVDDIGAGGGVVDILVEEEYPVNQIIVSEAPEIKEDPELGIFLNKRAQFYWKLKLAFEAGEVVIDDEELAFELSKMKIEFLRSGKIKIVDKDTIKKELKGRSPDRAESMMLAFSEEESTLERDMLRFL